MPTYTTMQLWQTQWHLRNVTALWISLLPIVSVCMFKGWTSEIYMTTFTTRYFTGIQKDPPTKAKTWYCHGHTGRSMQFPRPYRLLHIPQDSSSVMYWGIHIFMATTSLLDTRGRGSRKWLYTIVAWGSSEDSKKAIGWHYKYCDYSYLQFHPIKSHFWICNPAVVMIKGNAYRITLNW